MKPNYFVATLTFLFIGLSQAQAGPIMEGLNWLDQKTEMLLQKNLIDNRYRDNQDGTITDTQTKLTWKRCSEGQSWTGSTCTGEEKEYKWNDATQLTSNFAGKSDWRLPTIQELNTLVYCSNGKVIKFKENGYGTIVHEGDYGCRSNIRGEFQKPTINTQAFPKTAVSWFWSSSPDAVDSYYAWCVGFSNGNSFSNPRNNGSQARLVRGGQ